MKVVQEAVVLLRQSSVHMSQVVWQLEVEEIYRCEANSVKFALQVMNTAKDCE